jgi:hypothetical protein
MALLLQESLGSLFNYTRTWLSHPAFQNFKNLLITFWNEIILDEIIVDHILKSLWVFWLERIERVWES